MANGGSGSICREILQYGEEVSDDRARLDESVELVATDEMLERMDWYVENLQS
jgi:hypothetical protein